jgi:hypothetical protein
LVIDGERAISDREVVGASISGGGLASGTPKAVVWHDGADDGVTDLNMFLAANSPFIALLTAFGVNDVGEIAGFGVTSTGDVHAFLATPTPGEAGESAAPGTPTVRPSIAPEHVRRMIGGRFAIPK